MRSAVVHALFLAQAGLDPAPALAPRLGRALGLAAPPALDGRVLDDPAWQAVPPLDGFVQRDPREGTAASQRTEVRMAYTADTLFVGVVCYDDAPGKIVAAGGKRDSPLEESDSFLMVLDTLDDRQNGFVFGTTPAGLEFDGQITGGAHTSAPMGGQLAGDLGLNVNWNGSWQVRALPSDFGWSAEFAIPLHTLRYDGAGAQRWGVNFQRSIPRLHEVSHWSPLQRQQSVYQMSAAGTVIGLDLPHQRSLFVVPYALVSAPRSWGERDWTRDANAGLDAKWSVTGSLTLDATFRTDFAQVEVDQQQVNLDRFPLYFPEKRPFFLENAGFFAVGSPGELDLFFSRRIGIGPQGEVVPIIGGGRLSGKAGNFRVGLLDIQTEQVADVTSTNNFGVARLSYELPNRSEVGAFFASRHATGGSDSDDFGRTYAADGRAGIGRYGLVSGFVAGTEVPAAEGRPLAYSLSASYDSPAVLLETRYSDVGEGFDPQIGFLRRRDYRRSSSTIMYRYRPDDLFGWKELLPHASYRGYWGPDGLYETGWLHLDNYWIWRNGWEVHTAVNVTHEALREPFEIAPGIVVPDGAYDHTETMLLVRSNPAAPFSARAQLVAGGLFGGRRVSPELGIDLRASNVFTASLGWEHNRVALPAGTFDTNLGRARLTLSPTPHTFVQALLQYNDRTDLFSANLRVGWLRSAGTGLFLVYNENLDTATDATPLSSMVPQRHRSVTVKYSHLIDVLD